MAFNEKFAITASYITGPSLRRPRRALPKGVKFIVAHDTGNPGATANGHFKFYERTRDSLDKKDNPRASAQIFLDDKSILELIPAATASPEIAHHVLKTKGNDNLLYGFDANDAAIGVELCFGGSIDGDAAYKKYVWTLAFLCHKFGRDPRIHIVSHRILDPLRKKDPDQGLAAIGQSYDRLLNHVLQEYLECSGLKPGDLPKIEKFYEPWLKKGEVQSTVKLNVRSGAPNSAAPVHQTVKPFDALKVKELVDGETINGNNKWFHDGAKHYFWAGAVMPSD